MSQCNKCRYFSRSLSANQPICLVAWDGDDEQKTCEAVEWILMELSEAYSCPSFKDAIRFDDAQRLDRMAV